MPYANSGLLRGQTAETFEAAMEQALESWDRRVSTGRLNNWLKEVIAATPEFAELRTSSVDGE